MPKQCRCGQTFEPPENNPNKRFCSKSCSNADYTERRRKQLERVGNAKRKVVEGPCMYCVPQFGQGSRSRNGEICRKCLQVQKLHDAAQTGDETAAVEYIYQRAAEIRAENKEPQGMGRVAADTAVVELGARRGRVG